MLALLEGLIKLVLMNEDEFGKRTKLILAMALSFGHPVSMFLCSIFSRPETSLKGYGRSKFLGRYPRNTLEIFPDAA